MSRRATMGGPLGAHSSSSSNIAAGAADKRRSMAPNAGKSRQSMAPSASSSRMSMGGASLAGGSATARTSIGGIGLRNAATDRKSGGGVASGRRSSVGAGSRAPLVGGHMSDPRPLTDKNFIRENIKKIIVYLASHGYNQTLSPKQMAAPSTRDFKNIVQFLFSKVDPNFQFPDTAGAAAQKGAAGQQGSMGAGAAGAGNKAPLEGVLAMGFEDAVKFWMAKFAYPFNISKNALQAAGSPHTWPALLAMLSWLVDNLTYYELVNEGGGAGASSSLGGLAHESEARLFFEYVSGAYLSFLSGEDNHSVHDEALARKFQARDATTAEEVRRLEARAQEHQQAVDDMAAREANLADYVAFRNACLADIKVLEENIRNNRTYGESVQAKREARQTELEARNKFLEQCQAELVDLQATLARQEFTPLQVQEMTHQRAALQEALANQSRAQEALQNDIWEREGEVARRAQEIEALIGAFNEASMALAEATVELGGSSGAQAHEAASDPQATQAHIPEFVHEDLRFAPQADSALTMLSMDLKQHKNNVQASKEGLQAVRKELAQKFARQLPVLQDLQDREFQSGASVDVLAKRSAKLQEIYYSERNKMQKSAEAACSAVEDVEISIVSLRNELASTMSQQELEQMTADQVAQLDDHVGRVEAAALAEQQALKRIICDTMEELTQHKVNITENMDALVHRAREVRAAVAAIDVNTQ